MVTVRYFLGEINVDGNGGEVGGRVFQTWRKFWQCPLNISLLKNYFGVGLVNANFEPCLPVIKLTWL